MSELSDFILKAIEKGYTKDELSQKLLERGYTKKEIYSAFQSTESKSIGIEGKESSINYWEKIKLLFSKPVGFFEVVREPTIGKSIILYLMVLAVVFAIGFGISMLFSRIFYVNRFISLSSLFGLGYGSAGLFSIVFYILYFASSFVYAGISHLIIKWSGGNGKYLDTYNVCAYSLIPFVILTIIPLIGYLSFIYSIILMTFGFSSYHKISKGRAVTAALVPIILAIALLGILIFYLLSYVRIF